MAVKNIEFDHIDGDVKGISIDMPETLEKMAYTPVLHENRPLELVEQGTMTCAIFNSYNKDCFMFKAKEPQWIAMIKGIEEVADALICPDGWTVKTCFLDGDVIRLKFNKNTKCRTREKLGKDVNVLVDVRLSFYLNPETKTMGLFFDLDMVEAN